MVLPALYDGHQKLFCDLTPPSDHLQHTPQRSIEASGSSQAGRIQYILSCRVRGHHQRHKHLKFRIGRRKGSADAVSLTAEHPRHGKQQGQQQEQQQEQQRDQTTATEGQQERVGSSNRGRGATVDSG